MDDMKIFVPITKIDAAKRLIYGVVTAEKPDIAGEVCDYASTKPLYQKWSQKFAAATDGPVADLGCGPGQVGRFVRDRGRTVVGVDTSAAMAGRVARPVSHPSSNAFGVTMVAWASARSRKNCMMTPRPGRGVTRQM